MGMIRAIQHGAEHHKAAREDYISSGNALAEIVQRPSAATADAGISLTDDWSSEVAAAGDLHRGFGGLVTNLCAVMIFCLRPGASQNDLA